MDELRRSNKYGHRLAINMDVNIIDSKLTV
jgi:hypothetical protein